MRLPTQANAGVDPRRVDRLSAGLRRQSPGMCARSPRCRAGRSPTSGIERSPERPSPASTFRSGSGSTEIDLANLPPDLGEPRPGFVFFADGQVRTLFSSGPKLLSSRLGPTEIGKATPHVHGPITAIAPGQPACSLGQGHTSRHLAVRSEQLRAEARR